MLNEKALESLARNAPLRQPLVEMAWPSLAVESKLQLIHAIQNEGAFNDTPTWLMQLCIADAAPVVRYWAARNYTFADEHERVWPAFLSTLSQPIPGSEKELRAKATADSSELVRACVSKTIWDKEARLERLVFVRSNGTAHLVSGLSKAFDDGLSDEDLAESMWELLQKPEVQEDLKFAGSYSEGGTAYYEGKVVSDGWALVGKAGPKLRRLLAWHLPTNRGLGRIDPTALASMPVDVLEVLASRTVKTEEIETALELVLNNPEKYGEATVKVVTERLSSSAEYDGVQDDSPRRALAPGEETLAQVLSLKQQVGELTAKLTAMKQQIGAKRGLFF